MNAPKSRAFSARHLAVGLAGYCAFINLYSPQSILPLLSGEFGATAAQVSTIITVSTLAVAVTAPFTGTVADVLGRKRVIVTAMFALTVPTIMVALSQSLSAMIFWRAVQGLVLPPIFAVTVAYIGDEWPREEATTAAGIYSSGSSLGGFSGRLITGFLADLIGWRAGFMALAAIAFAGAIAVAMLLPHERKFVRSQGLLHSSKQMLSHFRNGQLLATYTVGFGVLFNFIATFTYISFHLAAAPYNFSSTLLGALFFTYLGGTAMTPWTGRLIASYGRRNFVLRVIAVWIGGALLLLAPGLALIIAGLVVCATCGMLCQSVSTGYIALSAKQGRSSAVGLYVTCFYVGGSVGAFLPGLTWTSFGWPGAVGMAIAMQVIMACVVGFFWTRDPARR